MLNSGIIGGYEWKLDSGFPALLPGVPSVGWSGQLWNRTSSSLSSLADLNLLVASL